MQQDKRKPEERAIHRLRARALYTSDISDLLKTKRHLLFYFSEDSNTIADLAKTKLNKESNIPLLYFGEAITASDGFALKRDTEDTLFNDLLFRVNLVIDKKRIIGHLFGVTTEQLCYFDFVMANNIYRQREKTWVICEDQQTQFNGSKSKRPTLPAWAYFANEDQFENWRSFPNAAAKKCRGGFGYFL